MMGDDSSTEGIYENAQEIMKEAADKGAAHPSLRQLTVSLGIVCVLLVASVSIIIWISVVMIKQDADIREQRMKVRNLENKTEMMSRERDDLNRTLRVVLTSDSVPLSKFCSDKNNQQCQESWVEFQEKCDLLHDENPPQNIRTHRFCQNATAELTVVDNLQEQKYVSNYTEYIYSQIYKYWMGLQDVDNSWIWIDGQNVSTGFWIKVGFVQQGPHSVVVPWFLNSCEDKSN